MHVHLPERSRSQPFRPRLRLLAGVCLLSTAVCLLLSPGSGALGQAAQKAGQGYGDLKEVTLRGKLIDLGEELSRKYGARTVVMGPEKQWALASPEGRLYTFLDNRSARKLEAAGPGGYALEVKARLFPRSMLLEILSFHLLPAESVRQKFYCGVCAITGEDWGPCICCGQEMEPVKP